MIPRLHSKGSAVASQFTAMNGIGDFGLTLESNNSGISALPAIPLEEADTVIRPQSNSLIEILNELIRHRGIFFNLLSRDLRRQYVDLRLGFLWVFSQPLVMTLIFALFRRGSGATIITDIPYSLYLLSGFVFWFIWVDACRVTASADRINAGLISKVFFPRLYSPLSAAASKMVGYGIGLAPIFVLQAYLGIRPSWTLVMLPFIVAQGLLLAFAIGLVFATLFIYGRDWDRVQGQILYLGLFVSPVIYSVRSIPEAFRTIYMLNPIVGTLDAFRASLTGLPDFPWGAWGYSWVVTLALLAVSTILFKRAEARLLDEL
ncbi:MAG: ABC transporter permease [Rhodospirillales bacterium]|jgi:lipopolysaccharide transport system permease protein|nr:ABC transporter permease [Rhodospirillales bacterium]